MPKKKKGTSIWVIALAIIGGIVVLYLIFGALFPTYSREELAEQYLINDGFSNPHVSTTDLLGETYAITTVEHWKEPHDSHVSIAIHSLYHYFPEVDYYSIIVVIDAKECTFIVDARDYRLWRDEGDNDAWARWHQDIEETGSDCK